MSIGPFLRRELVTSIRSYRAFRDRWGAVFVVGLIVLGSFLVWDRQQWDRLSISGAQRFGLAVLEMIWFVMALLAFWLALTQTATAIAAERDRKSLDPLLASEFSSAEIVLGAVAVDLFRFGNASLATVPVMVLKERVGPLTVVTLGAIGLVVGAVHPLGFLACLLLMATCGAFYGSLGLMMALLECRNGDSGPAASFFGLQAPFLVIGSTFLIIAPVFLGWVSLMTFEDVASTVRSGPFPEFVGDSVSDWLGARSVATAWISGTALLACGAAWLRSANERRFDALIGRPMRAGR